MLQIASFNTTDEANKFIALSNCKVFYIRVNTVIDSKDKVHIIYTVFYGIRGAQ